MGILFEKDNEYIAKATDAYKQRVQQYQTIYTADHADRLGKAASAYHWVDPSIITSTILSNQDTTLPLIADTAAKQMANLGAAPADNIRVGRTSQQQMIETTDFVQRMQGVAPPTTTIPVAPTSRTTASKKDQGFWGKVAHYSNLGTLFNAVTPNALQKAVGDVVRPSYSALKTGSQWFTGSQMFIPQMLQAEIYDAFNLFPSNHSFHSTSKKGLIDTFVSGAGIGALEQTALGQQAFQTYDYVKNKLDSSIPDTKWKDVAGDGFFTQGLSEVARNEAAYKYRPLVGTNPETLVPYTFGRRLAQVPATLGVIQEGGTAYNILSGLIDMGTWISLDPTMQSSILSGTNLAGKVYGKMSTGIKSKGALVALNDVEKAWDNLRQIEHAAAGVVQGDRSTVVPEVFDAWRSRPTTAKIIDPFVTTTKEDTANIWRYGLKGDGILTARGVAEAKTPEEVLNAIDKGVRSLDSSVNVDVRNLPAGHFNSVIDIGGQIKESTSQYTHIFDILPESTYIPQDNINLAARRLDRIMALFKTDMPTRNKWINILVDTHLDGSGKAWFDFYGAFEKNVLGEQLAKYGVPEERIKVLTRWSEGTTDMANRFNLTDILDGVPLEQMDANGYGPTRLTQLLGRGQYVFDPTQTRYVLRQMGAVEQYAKQLEQIGEKSSPVVRALTDVMGKTIDAGQSVAGVLETYQSRLWKIAKVAQVKYLLKVLPDEFARNLMSGTFDHPIHYIGAIFDGSWAAKVGHNGMYVADVFGEPINKAILVQELQTQLDEFRLVENEINRLMKNGSTTAANELLSMYADEINGLPALQERLDLASKQLEKDQFALHDALIGSRGTGRAQETIAGDYNTGVHVRTGIVDLPNKDIPAQREFWVRGIIAETADANRTEPFRRMANSGLFPGDVLQIDGITAKWADHVAAGRTLGYDDAIKQWLLTGDGKKYLVQYQKGRFIRGVQPSLEELASEWVNKIEKEVVSITGGNPTMLDVLATGEMDGKPAWLRDSSGVAVPSEEFRSYVKDVYANDPNPATPRITRNFKTITFRDSPSSIAKLVGSAEEKYNWVTNGFFKSVYGMASDKLARSPVWRRAYWGKIEEIAHVLNPEDAAKLLENAKKANLARPQLDRVTKVLELTIANKNGDQALGAADELARSFASKYYENLMFTSSQRSRFSQTNALMTPFFEAYREQASVWAKLLIERPQNAHYVDLALRALRSPLPAENDVNNDGKNDGFLFRDPKTGEEVFGVPLTGRVAQMFSGVPAGDFRISGKSMSLVTQVLPGFGPTVQMLASNFVPSTKKWEPFSNILFPYGRPEEQTANPFDPTPLVIKRMSPFAQKLLKEYAGAPGKMLAEMLRTLPIVGSDVSNDQVYQGYYSNVMKSLSSTQDPPKNSVEMNAFLNEVEDKTMKLYALRGLAGFVLPGQPLTQFMAESKMGKVDLGVYSDELQRFEKEAKDAGEPWGTGTARFLDMYGQNLWGMYGTSSAPGKVLGLQPSKEWDNWAQENKSLISDYSGVAAYFGPQDGAFDLSVWQRQKRSGLRPFKDPEQWVIDAENNVASQLYNSVRGSMNVQQQKSSKGKQLLSDFRATVVDRFPYWNPELNGVLSRDKRNKQIAELTNIVNDKAVSETNVGIAAKAYMDFRDATLASISAQYPTLKNWQQSNKTIEERSKLTLLGDTLAKNFPEFTPLWQNVLSNEYDAPEVSK